jgi:hypothetical protein
MLRALVITTLVAALASTATAARADTIYSVFAGGGFSGGASVTTSVNGTVDVDDNGQIISSDISVTGSFYTIAGYPFGSSGSGTERITGGGSSAPFGGNNALWEWSLGSLTLIFLIQNPNPDGTSWTPFTGANLIDLSSVSVEASCTFYPASGGGSCGEADLSASIEGGVGEIATTPLPPAFPLFCMGLGALCLFGWRRKRNVTHAGSD